MITRLDDGGGSHTPAFAGIRAGYVTHERPSSDRAVLMNTPSILIAEDHPDSRDALCALLEAMGYQVHVAADGREAVERAIDVRPDLILMDMMMPNMDGLEATRVLRATPGFGSTPIIALTAMEGARDRALNAGCSDYISKPVDVASFFRRVDEWLERERPAKE